MKDAFEGFEILATATFPFFLGIASAIANIARHGWKGFRSFLGKLALSGFYGVVMFWSLDLYDLPPTVKAAVTSGGAYALLELGDALFLRLETIIQNFELSDILGRMARPGRSREYPAAPDTQSNDADSLMATRPGNPAAPSENSGKD